MAVNAPPKFAQVGSGDIAITRTGAGGRDVIGAADIESSITTIQADVDALDSTKVSLATLTTKGDIFARNSSTVTRLAVGSSGQILIPDSPSTTGLKWGNLVFANDEVVANNDEMVTV